MKRNREEIIYDLKSKLLKGEETESLIKELEKHFVPRSISKIIKVTTKEIIDENLNDSLQLYNEQNSLEIVENKLKETLPTNLIKKVLEELAIEVTKTSKKKLKFEFDNSSISKQDLINKYSNEIVTENKITNWIKDHQYLIDKRNNEINSKVTLITVILILLCCGPVLDLFYNLSMFSRDPAPISARIISNIIFFLIYSLSTFLFIKKKYWARWISFSLYLFWFIISIFIISHLRHVSMTNYAEVLIRVSVLIILLKSTSWFDILKPDKS